MKNTSKIPSPREIEVKKRFIEKGISQEDIAKMLSFSKTFVNLVLSGERQSKDRVIEKKISALSGFDFEVLFFNIKRKR